MELGGPDEPQFEIPLTIYRVKSSTSQLKIEFVDAARRDTEDGAGRYFINGEWYTVVSWTGTSVRSLIRKYSVFGQMYLRAAVYGQILGELRTVQSAFRSEVSKTN